MVLLGSSKKRHFNKIGDAYRDNKDAPVSKLAEKKAKRLQDNLGRRLLEEEEEEQADNEPHSKGKRKRVKGKGLGIEAEHVFAE